MLKAILEWIAAAPVLGIMGVIRAMPERWSVAVGRRAGWLAWRLKIRRRVVEENLKIAFPEMPDEDRAQLIRRIYEHWGGFFGEWMSLGDKGYEQLKDDIEVEGIELLEAAVQEGRGVIGNTGHYGNWEVLARVVRHFVPKMYIVRRRLSNRFLDAAFTRLHEEGRLDTILTGSATREIKRALAEGALVGILADQNARRLNIFVPFFGWSVSFHRGPAMFARNTGAPFLSFFCLPGRRKRWRVVIRRVDVPRTGDKKADVRRVVEVYAGMLEEVIRAYPERWFWFHRKWKRCKPLDVSGEGAGPAGKTHSR